MRKNKILIAVLLYVAILAFVPTISAAGYPVPVQFFYVPIPEDQHLLALKTIESGGSGTDPAEPMQSYISISAIADNTIIYYDQYENGFESDIGNPVNIYTSANTGGTQIWGDGNTSNGFPPGVTSDIIKAGTVIVLNNPVTTTDSSTVIKYGGRDKIASTKTISVVRAGWSTGPNTLMADANEVFDTDSWGTDFRVPVGEDIPDTTDYQMFEYTGMTIMAGHGGATVNIDTDNSGSYETTKSLAEGESYLVNGGVKVGAHISSDNPVQIDLITGDKASNYESRFFRLLPTNLWSSSSYTPVSTPATVGSLTCGTTVWIYNPSSSALTVQYERRTASGLTTSSLSVPSNGYIKQVLTDGYGAHFYTTGNKFYALSTTDSTSSTSSNNQAWDWGFTLVPEDSLTSQLLVGLGIGRDPTSGTNPNENGNPVWVTPIGNGNNPVTIYVDYDADPTTGSFTDPNGNKYDKSYSLLECERAKVYKPSGDQTGMLLYTLDGTKLAGAWGQDPSAASAAAPGLDLGTGVPPTPLFDAGKTATLSEDRDNDGYVSPGDVILYTIVINNIARLPVSDILLQDSLPVDVSYVADSTTLYKSFTGTTTSITDSGSTAFPLDEGGIILDSNTALPVRQSYTVTFKVTIKNFVNLTPGVAQIVNTGYVSSDGVKTPFETRTPLYGSIGDFVWADIDGDGIQDANELGVANVTVNLLDGSGNPVSDVYGNTMTTLTNATGFYKFVGLLPGNYSVQFIKPAGYNFSLQDQGTNDTLDSDADPATGRTNAITLSAGETNNMMDAGLFNSIPKIGLEKSTNGEDADNAPGPYVGIGSTVTWTYNVTNTGNVNLTNVVVTDNIPGVTPAYVSGDNGNSILEVGESWIYNATGVAVAGQYANIGNVTADYKGTPVTDEDPSHYFGSTSAIDIEKSTNGEDADNAPGPYVGIGSTVTWTYNVTNTGNVNLTNVVVTDNIPGVTPAYVSGDNGNSILEVGESWIYNATGVATAGQYANIGNVTADYKGTPVTDEDPSHYFGSTSAIDIEKYTNGEDADNAPGPYVGIGSTVTWTYNVTNTGNVNLTNVVVSDNMGVIPTYVSGDNGNSILEVGESWIYNATGVAVAGQYANIGNVTADYKGTPVTDEDPSHYFGSTSAIDIEKSTNGEDADNAPGPYVGIGSTVTWTYNVTNTGNVNLTNVVVTDNIPGVTPAYVSGDNGNSILEVGESWIYNATGVAVAGQYANIGNVTADYKGTPVTDEDPSHYFGSTSAIDIEKSTNGEDADNAPGPYVGIGSTVTWTYNVTNTGNVNLTNVVVTDNIPGVTPAYVSGDNGNSILEVGESWIYNATGVATAGQYANIGNVTADYKGTPVTDEDPSHYFGSTSAIDIEKYTNGEDADNAPGPYVGIGSTVTWTYNVTNTGNVNLTNVVVTDNIPGVTPAYVSGDNGNSILEVGESWIYNATGVATAGQYANIGNVTADYKGTPVTDEDPSHYFGSSTAIDIEKYTNGEDADNAPGPYVGIGSTVTWTYNVTNTGNVNLTNVAVSDNMGVIPTYVSGDNGNSILEVGESWIYNATGVAVAGQYANIGNVTADYKGTPVTDEDPSHYFGSTSAIDIEKYTNGEDADNAPGPYVGIGSTVTWTYNVTNTGNVNLTNVVVTDNIPGVTPAYVSGDNGNSILEVGESWIYNATGVATAGQYANIGNVTADYKGTPVTDEDPSHYFGSTSAIDIEKYTNGEDADNAPGPYVGIGSTVTWTYNVTNTGNVNLTNVVVTDNIPGVTPAYVSGDNGNSILEVGESWIYNATGVATAGQYANIGNVTADYKGTPVTDEDPSHYFGSSTAIDIEKYTNGEDADNAPGPYVGIGSTVTWTYNVTNTGNVNLTNVAVSDNMGVIPTYVSGDNGNSILEVGESWIYNATGVAVAGQYANIGNVTADYKGTPVTDEDPSHYFGSTSAIDIEKSTNGEDADNAPGPYVGIGSTVTWTYNVTNTGNVNLTNVVVTDNIPGVTPAYVSGDNGNSILEVGESWIYNATGVATAGQYANIGNVTADYKGTPVTDEDPSHYFGSSTAIDIEKYTNGEDADNAPGPYVGIGSTVTWTYNVTNTGNVNLTNVAVSDNMGVIPTYVSGDNGNSILEVGESWIYNATGVAVAGQYANIGNVTADYKGTPVTDEDPSHYFGSTSAIDIEKSTNGEDADNAPGPYVGIGSTVTWTYNVTNTGNVNLTNVVVTDNIPGVTPAYVSGDNGNSILEVGESWIYNATGVATAGQYANIGNVTADYKGTPVTDEDPSHYFGLSGAIDIEKYVWNGTGWEDADTVTGPSLSSGPVKFKIIVTNIGNVALTGISVIDSKYGPITLSTTTLGVGNSTEAEYNMTWASGQQVNTATVEGYYDSTKYTDSDDAHYYGPVSLQAQYDNRLRESSSCVVFSKATYLDVGKNVSRSRDVLWFDLSKFNKTDVVSKATLSLFWYYPEAATRKYDTIVDIYRPISWDQKYVTWYYISQSKKWPIVGGTWYDKNNVSQGSTPYGSVTFPAGKVPDNKYYEFDVTQLVQEYINGKYKNTGFFLKARMENGNYIAFYSSDWPNADQRPKLTVSLANGSTPATPAVVDNPPVANAGADQSVTLGSTVSFDGSSSTDDKSIMSYSWNFGDSTTSDSTIATANHAYTTAGTYTVNLTVTDTIGQKDSDTLQVVVSASSTPTGASSSYMAVADNRLRQTSPSTVYSTTNYLDVGKGASSSRDVILFDLSAYNKTDTISKATLSLYWYYPSGASRTSDTMVQIYRPAEWDPKYVSWNNRMNGISWNKAGGDWYDQNGISQGSTPYASLAFSAKTVPGNKYYEFDVTKLVQQYINGTYKNTGFFIKAGTESGNYIAFYSSEYSNAAMRPKLTVTR